eukprot:364261-Chlamydomonas_euryale.AAC.8
MSVTARKRGRERAGLGCRAWDRSGSTASSSNGALPASRPMPPLVSARQPVALSSSSSHHPTSSPACELLPASRSSMLAAVLRSASVDADLTRTEPPRARWRPAARARNSDGEDVTMRCGGRSSVPTARLLDEVCPAAVPEPAPPVLGRVALVARLPPPLTA